MKNRFTPSTLKTLCAAALVAAAAVTAPAQTASTTYRASQRDPFTKYKPAVKRKVEKSITPVTPPTIQARIDNYKAQKQAAMSRQQAAPKPTTALLLSEMQVKGIFRTPRGYAAMVQATPINLSYVIYPGEQFYDGMLVAIEESRLVFRKQTKFTDGRTVVAVESKSLVQPTVADQLTAQREAEKPMPTATAEKKSDVTQLIEALKALAAGAQPSSAEPQPAEPQGKP